MVEVTGRVKTLLCVALAGALFVPAVLLNLPLLVIPGAVADWLPLPTGWMRRGEERPNRKAVAVHIILTLVAYIFVILWVALSLLGLPTLDPLLRLLFLETWWFAVMSGSFIF